MGGQDADLIKRAIALQPSVNLLQIPIKAMPLQNKKSDGLTHTHHPEADWNSYNEITTQKSLWALTSNTLTANQDGPVGVKVHNGYDIDRSILTQSLTK
jgi:hypothetical protein